MSYRMVTDLRYAKSFEIVAKRKCLLELRKGLFLVDWITILVAQSPKSD
jgi:hypothetical protein